MKKGIPPIIFFTNRMFEKGNSHGWYCAKIAASGEAQVGKTGSSLYCEKFLSCGFEFLPRQLRVDVPHLRSWSGIAGLKNRLREFVGISEPAPVLLASRSAYLMTLAANCLFRRCHNVMTIDAEWPPYLAILQRVAARTKRKLTVVPYRQVLLQQRATVIVSKTQNAVGNQAAQVTDLNRRNKKGKIHCTEPPPFVHSTTN